MCPLPPPQTHLEHGTGPAQPQHGPVVLGQVLHVPPRVPRCSLRVPQRRQRLPQGGHATALGLGGTRGG